MSEQVIIPADLLPQFLPRPQIPEQMVKDLITISQVPREELLRLAESLQQQEGFLDSTRLATEVGRVLKHEPQLSAAIATITNLHASRLGRVLQGLRRWSEADPKNAERIPNIQGIDDALRIIVRDYPALARFRKAQFLGTLTGQRAESVEFLCDLRPVFDEDRHAVEGVIPLTTLRIEYEPQEESTRVFEVIVPEAVLDEFIVKAQIAKQKLDVLRSSVPDWLPDGWVQH